MFNMLFSFLLLTLSLPFLSFGALQCIDNDGNPVDWYYVYKLNDGTKYAYYDSTTTDTILTPMTNGQTLDAGSNSCIERTTQQIYDNKESINWLLYNDENAINGVTNYTCGHSKGMLAFTKYDDSNNNNNNINNNIKNKKDSSSISGFYMIHSAPKFPNISTTNYVFAHNAITYGQNFLCITIDNVESVEAISMQLRYITPWVYAFNNINKNTKGLDNYNSLLNSEFLNGSSVVNLTSAHVNDKDTQLIFNHLAKSGSTNYDIFEDVISTYYKLGFQWETWQDSSSDEDIYCTPNYEYDEEDIEELTLGDGWYVENKDDHSKFGLSINSNIVCSGDMNRATTQEPRGGGYACFQNDNFYNVITNTITDVESCT